MRRVKANEEILDSRRGHDESHDLCVATGPSLPGVTVHPLCPRLGRSPTYDISRTLGAHTQRVGHAG